MLALFVGKHFHSQNAAGYTEANLIVNQTESTEQFSVDMQEEQQQQQQQ